MSIGDGGQMMQSLMEQRDSSRADVVYLREENKLLLNAINLAHKTAKDKATENILSNVRFEVSKLRKEKRNGTQDT